MFVRLFTIGWLLVIFWGFSQLAYSQLDSDPPLEIRFEQDQIFGSTDEVIIGDISTFTVDNRNRVYIGDSDRTIIHVFNPDGSYRTSLGREGKGPGEFLSMIWSTLTIHSNRLIVTDGMGRATTEAEIFKLEELSFSHSMRIHAKNKRDYEELEGHYPRHVYPLNNDTYLVSYRQPLYQHENKASIIYYVVQDSDGHILRGPVLKQKDLTYLSKQSGGIRLMHYFPFYGKPLLIVSDENRLYAARSEEFKIEIYNSKGMQINTIQHTFKNKVFDSDKVLERYEKSGYMEYELGEGVPREMIMQADNLPETWPALETMIFDDVGRLWVATIVDDVEVYEWWILRKSGKVVAKFEWPREKPIEEIQNGYIYTQEADKETGIEEIIRYKIID